MWQGPTDGILSFYECRFSGGDTMRWWRHSNPTLCKKICLNFFALTDSRGTKLRVQMLVPWLAPELPGETFTNNFYHPQTKFAKVRSMFLQVSVCPQGRACMARGCAWQGGMHGRNVWGCVHGGRCVWQGWHVWWGMPGGVHGRGCMARGVCGRGACTSCTPPADTTATAYSQ